MMSDLRIRPKKTLYQNDEPRTLAFFKLAAFNDSQDDLDSKIWVVTGTLLSNVTFELDDPMNSGQLISYTETETKEKLAGTKTISTSESIVIAEYLFGTWFIIKELVVPDV